MYLLLNNNTDNSQANKTNKKLTVDHNMQFPKTKLSLF